MNQFPARINAGVTLDAVLSFADHPAGDWTVTVALRGPAVIDLTATADGDDHAIDVAADVTSDWTPGRYAYWIRGESDGHVDQLEEGYVTVLPDPSNTGAPHETSSHARRVLAAVEAVIEGTATLEQRSYKIGNRELQRRDIAELLKLRTLYRAEVRTEERRQAGRPLLGRQWRVRFSQ